MESEFDKEIDVLLRQAARRGETVSKIAGSHLDADEINAFAEQMLTGKAQIRAVAHLADCSRCRNILANLTLFNAETESEIVHAPEKKFAPTPALPWYKKLFSFPQLAYAMGISALIFGGIIAGIVLQNPARNSSSEVAQMNEERQLQPAATVAANANISQNGSANSSLSNYSRAANVSENPSKSENKNNSAQANSSVSTADKKAEPAKPAPKMQPLNEAEEHEKSGKVLPAAPPAPAKSNEDDLNAASADAVSGNRQADAPQNYASQNQMRQSQATPDTRSVQNLPQNARNTSVLRKAERRAEMTAAGKEASGENGEFRIVNGRNFRRAEGVWYDVDYKSQKTINLRRGSEDYKKLAANLRSIAERLGGVVVIVSGGTAYRIQ